MELRVGEGRAAALEVELLARVASDLPALRALETALGRAGVAAALSATSALRGAREGLAPGPRPCRARVIVVREGPRASPAGPDPRRGAEALVALLDGLALPSAETPLSEELLQADLVLAPNEAHARIPARGLRVEVVGAPRLDSVMLDPELARARTRRELALPDAEPLLLAQIGSAEELDLLCTGSALIGLIAVEGSPSECGRLGALAARRARVVLLDLVEPERAAAAADVVCAPPGELRATALALGVPCLSPAELSAATLRGTLDRALAQRRTGATRAALPHAGRAAERAAAAICALLSRPGPAPSPAERTRDEGGAAELLAAFGDAEGALAEIEAELARAPSAESHTRRAALLRKAARLEAASGAAEQACAAAMNTHARALCERARIEVEQGRVAEATLTFERAHELAPGLADPPLGLGSLALHRGDAATARGLFEAALAREPSARAHSGLGLTKLSLADPRDALVCFERALDLEPDCIAALYGLVQAGFETGELARAEARLARFLELHPANLDMLFTAAGLRLALGLRDPARELVERIELFDASYPGLAELRAKLQG